MANIVLKLHRRKAHSDQRIAADGSNDCFAMQSGFSNEVIINVGM